MTTITFAPLHRPSLARVAARAVRFVGLVLCLAMVYAVLAVPLLLL